MPLLSFRFCITIRNPNIKHGSRHSFVKACTPSTWKSETCCLHQAELNAWTPFSNIQIMSWCLGHWLQSLQTARTIFVISSVCLSVLLTDSLQFGPPLVKMKKLLPALPAPNFKLLLLLSVKHTNRWNKPRSFLMFKGFVFSQEGIMTWSQYWKMELKHSTLPGEDSLFQIFK